MLFVSFIQHTFDNHGARLIKLKSMIVLYSPVLFDGTTDEGSC